MQGLGACLTMSNLDDIKRFIEDFAVRALLPAMEARVRALNHQVSHAICLAAGCWRLPPSSARWSPILSMLIILPRVVH